MNECDKMNKDLVDVYEKLKEVEWEIENLKELLSMKIKKEFDNCVVDVSDKIIWMLYSDFELEFLEIKDNVIFFFKVEYFEIII